jgi:hypothetical protein
LFRGDLEIDTRAQVALHDWTPLSASALGSLSLNRVLVLSHRKALNLFLSLLDSEMVLDSFLR